MLVVSHDGFHSVAAWKSVTVVPLTISTNQARRGPTAVPIADGAGRPRGDGIAGCHQITPLDRGKLSRRLGALPADVLLPVEVGIKAALDPS